MDKLARGRWLLCLFYSIFLDGCYGLLQEALVQEGRISQPRSVVASSCMHSLFSRAFSAFHTVQRPVIQIYITPNMCKLALMIIQTSCREIRCHQSSKTVVIEYDYIVGKPKFDQGEAMLCRFDPR